MTTDEPNLRSIITCPECAGQSEEAMPTDACLFFYDFPWHGHLLRPLKGDCCVFCSYGSVPRPPVQASGSKGGAANEDCCG